MSTIKCQNLSFAYGSGPLVLKNISFELSGSRNAGIVGANGTGKSTLMRLMVGLNTGYTGSLRINDIELSQGPKALAEARRRIGYVFQDSDSQLFMSNAYEDIAFGPRNMGLPEKEVEARVIEAMELTRCTHLKDKSTYKMSGGEKKLVSIAGILAMKPDIIIMDEPSAALDPRNRRMLINVLKELPCMKLITSHDLDLIWDTCERTILLGGGEIKADGATKEILSNEQLTVENDLEVAPCCRR